jgi:hypothetical protein
VDNRADAEFYLDRAVTSCSNTKPEMGMSAQTISRSAPTVWIALGTWLVVALAAGAAGLVERYPLPVPSLVALLTATLLALLWMSPSLREWVWTIGPVPLVALHLSRFVGIAFLLLSARGELPPAWALPTGWGDIAVATLAIPLLLLGAPFHTTWSQRSLLAWNVVGLIDMLAVVLGAVRMVMIDPAAGGVMVRLPMSLLPTFLVPLILVSHVLLFVWLEKQSAWHGRSG